MSQKPEITAQTRVADLLDHYPQLEQTLISQAPMFRKIENPVLRRTVAKVATLEKAAAMADIPVERLVDNLREAAGLPRREAGERAGTAEAPGLSDTPDWVSKCVVAREIDADKLLEEGENPLKAVQKLAGELDGSSSIRILSSFPPIPLTDTVRRQGHDTHTKVNSSGGYETFIRGMEKQQ